MKNITLFIAIVIALAVIISAWFVGNAYKYKYKSVQAITATGNAIKDFESDIVKWRANYSRKAVDLAQASQQLKSDQASVRAFLIEKGVDEKEIVFEAVNISKDFAYRTDQNGYSSNVFTGYVLSQYVTIDSRNLDIVETVSREISSLISQGIELSSSSPNYYYSQLEDLKLELISQASENARQRAENIADKAKSGLGKLLKADLGVFQITGRNDNEDYSYGGAFNTTARNKTANITVKLTFMSK